MIITGNKKDTKVVGALETHAFTIKASAKSFEILASNLYSNKLGAMVRELSTNAYDAHVMVGKENEPFDIKLATTLDPTFKIRDYGPGLTEDEINSIYTTFFESTKTNSNDVVGCLGLGSKSPFAISDSFTINSYKDGKKYIYSAFLNEERIPTIAKFGEFDTDEPNGLEIEVAMDKENIISLKREVNYQLRYFKVKPNIKGDSSFEWNDPETYYLEGEGWKLSQSDNSPYVIQGQIAYPIDTYSLGSDIEGKLNEFEYLILTRSGLRLEVNIGDVNIAPSREALTYDRRTIENIIGRVKEISGKIIKAVEESIQKAETEFEAIYEVQNAIKPFRNSYSFMNNVDKIFKLKWRGKDISALAYFISTDGIDAWIFDKVHRKTWKKEKYYTRMVNEDGKNVAYYVLSPENNLSDDVPSYHYKEIYFYIPNAKTKGSEKKLKYYMEEKGISKSHRAILFKSDMSFEKFKKEILPGANLIDLEPIEVPKTETKRGKAKPVTEVPCYYDMWSDKDKWTSNSTTMTDDDFKGEHIYVELDRYNVMYKNEVYGYLFSSLYSLLTKYEIIDSKFKILGLRTKHQKKLEKVKDESKMKHFFEFAYEKIIEKNIKVYQMSYSALKDFASEFSYSKKKIEHPFLIDLLEHYSMYNKQSYRIDATSIITLFKLVGKENEIDKVIVSDDKFAEIVKEKYPMLQMRPSYVLPTDEMVKVVENYLKTMDNVK